MMLLVIAEHVLQTLLLNLQKALRVPCAMTLKNPMQVQHSVPNVQQVNTCQQIVSVQTVQLDNSAQLQEPPNV